MRFDARLRIAEDVADQIAAFIVPDGTAFMTDAFPFPLTAEIVAGQPRLRAATGEEVTTLLTTGGFPPEKGIDWPGDPALAAGRDVEWQINPNDLPTFEDGCRLWAGEVLLSSGQGMAGPFYIHELAAGAWAFSEALKLPESEVFEVQVAPYVCARAVAPSLLRNGEAAFRSFRRGYTMSPVRPAGAPTVLRCRTALQGPGRRRTSLSSQWF